MTLHEGMRSACITPDLSWRFPMAGEGLHQAGGVLSTEVSLGHAGGVARTR